MLNDLEALEVFASLCTTGSIQKTAQALGIDSPTASRKLTKLETQLGRQLINREKRPFEMTADACAIIGSVKKILEERQQIETYYRRLQSDDAMLIRVMIAMLTSTSRRSSFWNMQNSFQNCALTCSHRRMCRVFWRARRMSSV